VAGPKDGYTADKRWEGQKELRLRLRDLACMTKEEAVLHERGLRKGNRVEDMYDRNVVNLVEQRMNDEEGYERYR
jgi:hypothetical protein